MATIRGINVVIGADTTGLTAALKDVNDRSKEISTELKQVERLLRFNPSDTELLAQKQKLLSEQVANTSEKLKRLRDVQEQVNEQFKKGEISEEQHRAFQRELIKTESQLNHYEKQLKEVNASVSDFKQKMDEAGKSLDSAGRKMSDTGVTVSKKVTAPLLGLGAVAAKIGMDFEASMSKVKASSGATEEEMQTLEKAARDAGASTSKSASDAADALGYMALAGWDTKESIDGLMPVLRLSEAGNIDLARASSLVTDSMSALGLTTKDLPRYLDVVAQTARNSNTDIDQMAAAYIGVGGTLRGLRVPIEESSVALGMLANAGIKGSESGKALNSILVNLTAPAGRAKDALNDLGFTAFDSEGNFKGLEAVLFELKDELSGMTEEQRNMTLSMIGGKEHVKSLNALLNGLDDSYVGLKASVNDADGALDDMAKTMLDNNKGSLIELSSALEELSLKVYDIMKPVIASVTSTVKGLVDWLNELDPVMQRNIVLIAGIAAAIGPVLIIVGKLTSGVGALLKTLGTLTGFIKSTLIPAISSISMSSVATVAGIAALAAIAYEVYRAWDEVTGAVAALWELLKASAVQLGLNIAITFEEMKVAVIRAVDSILDNLSVLERLPFGIGQKFAGLRDGVSNSVDVSNKKIAELRKSAEENSARISTAVEDTKVAFSDFGTKIADDVKGVVASITGMTTETAEAMEEQTEVVEEQLEDQVEIVEIFQRELTSAVKDQSALRTEIVEESEEEQTEIVSEEAEKRAAERAKFEQSWNDKLFKLTADRLEQLEAEYEATIALAKELEADVTAVEEYFEIKRQALREEAAEKRESYEQQWNQKLVELTGEGAKSRLELLAEKEAEALQLAEDLEADITDVKRVFSLLREQIIQEENEAEKTAYQEKIDLAKSWEDRLFEATATEEEVLMKKALDQIAILREQMDTEIELANEKGLEIADITAYYAVREQQIRDELNRSLTASEEEKINKRSEFEENWNKKLGDLTKTELEIRLDALKEQEEAALAQAEKLEADLTDVKRYFAMLRTQIEEEEAEKQDAINEQRRKDIETFEANWARKVFEQSATRLEILEAEYHKALDQADELEADVTDIVIYYENERRKLREETELRREELLKSWQDRLFEATASEEELLKKKAQDKIDNLKKQMAEELALASENLLSKVEIEEYYASEIKRIQDELSKELEKPEKERMQKRAELEESYNNRLIKAVEERVAILEVEKNEAVRLAEEQGLDVTEIAKSYEDEQNRLREEAINARLAILRKACDKEIDEAKKVGADITAIQLYYENEEKKILLSGVSDKQKIRDSFEQSWNDKLFKLTASRAEIRAKEREDAIKEAKRQGQDVQKVVEYYEALEKKTREDFEKDWNRKYLELTDQREKILEMEKKEAIETAKELGADTTAIIEYYHKKQIELAEERAKEHQNIWQRMGLTVEKVTKDIANNVVDMFNSNFEAEQKYKNERAKVQKEIAEQIEELDKKRLKELANVIDNTAEKEEIERKYAELKEELYDKEKKLLEEKEQTYKENRLSIKDVLKDMVIDLISALQKQIAAQELAAIAAGWAMSITTLGASLATLAAALPKIAAQLSALELLKAGVRGLATGGVVKGGTDQVFRLGDGKEDEAVLPLNASVFDRLAKGITQQMTTTNTITQNVTIQSPTPLTPSEVARKNKQQLRNLALEWGM